MICFITELNDCKLHVILVETLNSILYGATSRVIFSTDQSVRSLLILDVLKPNTHSELLSDWSIYLIVFPSRPMIEQSMMNEWSADMTPYRVPLPRC
jgi:hypothetical protein